VPEYFIGAFSKCAEFMKDFGDKFLYLDTLTRHFGRLCLSKLRTSKQITYGTSTRMLVNHFKKNVNDAKILKDLFGKATLYGSEVCDVLCWIKVYSVLAANRKLLRGLSEKCFKEFLKALKGGLIINVNL
jgi:hypothetical protein